MFSHIRLLIGLVVLSFSIQIFCQAETEKKKDVLDTKIEYVNEDKSSMDSFLSRTLRKQEPNLWICLEKVPLPWVFTRDKKGVGHFGPLDERNIRIIKLKNKTMREILNELVRLDPRYCWVEKDGVVNIIPVKVKNDPNYPLNQRVKRFTLNTKDWQECMEAVSKLTGPYNIVVKMSGLPLSDTQPLFLITPSTSADGVNINELSLSDIKLHHITLNLKNVTIREILNQIAKQASDSQIVCTWTLLRPFEGKRCINFEYLSIIEKRTDMVPGDYIRPGDEKKHEEFMKEHEQYEKWMEEYRKTGKWPGPPNVPIRKEKKKD